MGLSSRDPHHCQPSTKGRNSKQLTAYRGTGPRAEGPAGGMAPCSTPTEHAKVQRRSFAAPRLGLACCWPWQGARSSAGPWSARGWATGRARSPPPRPAWSEQLVQTTQPARMSSTAGQPTPTTLATPTTQAGRGPDRPPVIPARAPAAHTDQPLDRSAPPPPTGGMEPTGEVGTSTPPLPSRAPGAGGRARRAGARPFGRARPKDPLSPWRLRGS
jgi:hypothetical protein